MNRMIAATFALIGLAFTTGAFAADERPVVKEGEVVHVARAGEPPVSTEINIIPRKCPEGQEFVCRFSNSGAGSCQCEPELEEK